MRDVIPKILEQRSAITAPDSPAPTMSKSNSSEHEDKSPFKISCESIKGASVRLPDVYVLSFKTGIKDTPDDFNKVRKGNIRS